MNPLNETLVGGTLLKKELRVKRIVRVHTEAFRQMAVERMKECANIKALAKELGIHQRLLYRWRDRLESVDDEKKSPSYNRERALRDEANRLKRLLGEKALELDFFKGALQKVEARRQSNTPAGEAASTTRSGS